MTSAVLAQRSPMYSPLLATLFLLTVAPLGGAADVCSIGRVTLGTLPRMGFPIGASVYTLGFCSVVQPMTGASCPTPGFVTIHDSNTGSCTASYDTLVIGLTQTNHGVFYIAARSDDPNRRVNVSIGCERGGSPAQASLIQPLIVENDGALSTVTLRLMSRAGCSIDNYLCSATVSCASPADTCFNGVCIDSGCARLEPRGWTAAAPAVVGASFSATDCNGRPIVNMSAADLTMTLDGIDVNDRTIAAEIQTLVRATQDSPVPQLTTLVFDQSRSVLDHYQEVLVQGARAFVDTVLSSNANHFIALLGFDGGTLATVLLSHTNDRAAVMAAIDGLRERRTLGDPDSTNLYGAIVSGLRESYQMKYSFGNVSDQVVSSMIFFTDGFDTARRIPREAAVNEALRIAPFVQVVAFGVANESDSNFLAAIATSGSHSSVSAANLVTSFVDVAARLTLARSNNYLMLHCVPIRSASFTATVAVAPTRSATSNVLSHTFSASGFTRGCTMDTLNSVADNLLRSSPPSAPGEGIPQLVVPQSVTANLSPRGAAVMRVLVQASDLPVTILLTPPTHTLYLRGDRCILSPYCYDGAFNQSHALRDAGMHSLMLTSSSDSFTTVTVTTVGAPAATATPTSTGSGGLPTPPSVNLSDAVERFSGFDVDEDATVIFVSFGVVYFVIIIIVVCKVACLQHVPQSTGLQAQYHSPPHLGRSLQKPLMASVHPTHTSLTPPMLMSEMSSPRRRVEVHSIFTEQSPYRTSGFSGDSSVAGSRFTPSRAALSDHL